LFNGDRHFLLLFFLSACGEYLVGLRLEYVLQEFDEGFLLLDFPLFLFLSGADVFDIVLPVEFVAFHFY